MRIATQTWDHIHNHISNTSFQFPTTICPILGASCDVHDSTNPVHPTIPELPVQPHLAINITVRNSNIDEGEQEKVMGYVVDHKQHLQRSFAVRNCFLYFSTKPICILSLSDPLRKNLHGCTSPQNPFCHSTGYFTDDTKIRTALSLP